MPVQTQLQQRRGTAASWTSTNPTLAAGEIGFESDTGKIKIGNGSTAWNALAYTASSTAVTYLYNATAAQTTFSGTDANGLTLAYTVGAEQVYLNGALQVRGSDYTATNGTSIVLTSGALVNDVLNVIAFSALALSDTYTQAQADAKFFQNANAFLAGKNKIINGDFSINQRAFTSSTTSTTYGFDRWRYVYTDGTVTYSAQTFTPGTAPVVGYEGTNFARLVTTGQTAASARAFLNQRIESVRTFAGQTITVSFWAKANTGTPSIAVAASQIFGTGGSVSVTTPFNKVTISTSWARYSITGTLPSISGKTIAGGDDNVSIPFWVSAGSDSATEASSIGIQSNTFDIWGVQVEAGSIATPFQTATGTLQGELAACQRYFQRYVNGADQSVEPITMAQATASTSVTACLRTIVPMRTSPSGSVSSGSHFQCFTNVGGLNATSAIVLEQASPRSIRMNATTTGMTAGNASYFIAASASATLDLSAEL